MTQIWQRIQRARTERQARLEHSRRNGGGSPSIPGSEHTHLLRRNGS